METAVISSLFALAGVVAGLLIRPAFDRKLSRDQWQRSAIADLIQATVEFDRAAHEAFSARTGGTPGMARAAHERFRSSVGTLEGRLALILDEELRARANRYRLAGITAAEGVAPGTVGPRISDIQIVNDLGSTYREMTERATAVLARLG